MNTQTELEMRVSSIAQEVEEIAADKRWKWSTAVCDDTTAYSVKEMIAKAAEKIITEKFFEIIESALYEVEVLNKWLNAHKKYQKSGTLTDRQKMKCVQKVLAYVKTLDEDSIEDSTFLGEIISLLVDADEIEQAMLDDYFDANLGIEFCVDHQLDIKGVEVCVAHGGPAIYVDSNRGVWGIWWSEKAECDLTRNTKIALDEWGERQFELAQAWAGGRRRAI
jgi:cell fate (sporulation/competence/biofilm development) regulator YmcA (YheA/YmcA/DUF963 family)